MSFSNKTFENKPLRIFVSEDNLFFLTTNKKTIHYTSHMHSNMPVIAIIGNKGLTTVLVSQGCHNEVPQTKWLKTTELHALTVPKAGSLKSRCLQS